MPSSSQPIDLFFWPTPNGHKISIALEELGLPYEVVYINIGKNDQFIPEFLKIAPNNRMPAIIDYDGPGSKPISIFESGAILQYLARKTGKLCPADERGRVLVEQWLMWQMGGFGPMLGQNHHFALYAPEKIPYAIKRYQDESRRLYRVLNTQLDGREYVAGDYSIADISMIGWARGYERQAVDIDEVPNVKRWMETMLSRPAVQRGLAVGTNEAERVNLADNAAARARLVAFSA